MVGITVDWVKFGAVSEVKDEGECQANYAFSAVGAVEGANYIWTGNSVEFSAQQVVDCSSSYHNNGCTNGRMDNTFNYIRDKGITTSLSYPYVRVKQSCKSIKNPFYISGYQNITSKDCPALQTALIHQPISVGLDGNDFSSYNYGIFSKCGTKLSVAGLLVGMTDTYWMVKLSWGTDWGEFGYIKLARGNTCGICQQASYPTRWA